MNILWGWRFSLPAAARTPTPRWAPASSAPTISSFRPATTVSATGCSDDEYPWARDGEENKYPYVVHAELNAILNSSGKSLHGARIYVALFPCNECAKAIIQSGIREVIYLSDKYAGTPSMVASRRMFQSAGVKVRQLETQLHEITLSFEP